MRRREDPYAFLAQVRLLDLPGEPRRTVRPRVVALLAVLVVAATASTALAWHQQDTTATDPHRAKVPAAGTSAAPPTGTAGTRRPGSTASPTGEGSTALAPLAAEGSEATRAASGKPTSSPASRAPFTTLPSRAPLPTGNRCAAIVNAHPSAENRPANAAANSRPGHRLDPGAVDTRSTDPRARHLVARVDGHYTGSTRDILRWGACKWGLDENAVQALADVQSSWKQNATDDWLPAPKDCPPGHRLGADGRPGLCPQTHGIMQVRHPYLPSAFPGAERSTAMNVDATLAVLRSCYEGYEKWLDDVRHGHPYQAGDLWGCVGRWYTGRWYTPEAVTYIARVRAATHSLPAVPDAPPRTNTGSRAGTGTGTRPTPATDSGTGAASRAGAGAAVSGPRSGPGSGAASRSGSGPIPKVPTGATARTPLSSWWTGQSGRPPACSPAHPCVRAPGHTATSHQ